LFKKTIAKPIKNRLLITIEAIFNLKTNFLKKDIQKLFTREYRKEIALSSQKTGDLSPKNIKKTYKSHYLK
jgi:hypothetical protein